jgi:hypothetical protein
VPEGGPEVHVLFDERHDLEGGELVRLHEFTIGVVDNVDLDASRVRATIRLAPDALENLTAATTWLVVDDDGQRYLETYVLDSDAEALAAGATLAGADGAVELMSMRARAAAGSLADDALSSEWWNEASDFLDAMKRDLDAADWDEEERELRDRWERAMEQMERNLEQGEDALARTVDELVEELEKAGRSDEAQKLKRRFEEFLQKMREELR